MQRLRPTPRARPARHLAGLLLALLALRALVPAGFMAAPSADGLQMAFCESGAAGGLHHGHAPGHGHSSAADPACPFAQSAGPAPLPAVPALAGEPPRHAFEPAAPGARAAIPPGPPRQQTPRGPPRLA